MASAQDAPDWLSIPGGWRFIGDIHLAGSGSLNGNLAYAPTAYDGAILILPVGGFGNPAGVNVSVLDPATLTVVDAQSWDRVNAIPPSPFVCAVNQGMGASWTVAAQIVSAAGAADAHFYVLAIPSQAVSLVTTNAHPVTVQGNPNAQAVPTDPTDEPARQLGVVSVSGTVVTDPTDEPARQLGVVSVSGNPADNVAQWGGGAVNPPITPSDTHVNTDLFGPAVVASTNVWDNVNGLWRRVRNMDSSVDGNPADQNGNLQAMAKLNAYNGTEWDRLRSQDNSGDGIAGGLGRLVALTTLYGWSSSQGKYDRLAIDLAAAADQPGYLIVRHRGHTTFGAIDPAANTAGTITLVAAGAGLFHYITGLRFVRAATAALAGSALLTVTTTNLGGRQWRAGNAMVAGGTQVDVDEDLAASPIRSAVANTATTLAFPAPGAAVAWSCRVEYFVSPEVA